MEQSTYNKLVRHKIGVKDQVKLQPVTVNESNKTFRI